MGKILGGTNADLGGPIISAFICNQHSSEIYIMKGQEAKWTNPI